MDFEHSAKTRDYMQRLTAFMDQHVYPNEKTYHEQVSQPGQRWNEGDPNFEAIRGWNKAMVYAKTVAAFAERLEGGAARAEDIRR